MLRLLDEFEVHSVAQELEGLRPPQRILAGACEVHDAVADLGEHAQHVHVARRRELEGVDQAVPEGLGA